VQIDLADLTAAGATIATLRLVATPDRSGGVPFMLDTAGSAPAGKTPLPFTMALGGAVKPAADGADLRLDRLTGRLDDQPVRLTRPVTLAKHGEAMRLADLSLALGPGSIAGSASLDPRTTAADLRLSGLPLAFLGRLGGAPPISGTLGATLALSGPVTNPTGHAVVTLPDLRLALASRPDLPPLNIVVSADLANGRVDGKGRVAGPGNTALGFLGSGPLVVRAAPFSVVLPPEAPIRVKAEGEGLLENLADLLPLGEDRASGRFAIDAEVGGTVAHPTPNGRLTLTDGHYDNEAAGTELAKLNLDLAGNGTDFVLRRLSATDGASGTLEATGGVRLGSGSPVLDATATLKSFLVAKRDEAIVTASGTATVSGPLDQPKATASITVERGDLTIPSQLPPSVVTLDVVRIDSRKDRNASAVADAAAAPPPPPAVVATLDVELKIPGQFFVRGRGVDSEWRGNLKVTGTSAAPIVLGQIEEVRGTISLLGKDFTLQRGTIGFDGSGRLDPTLDIEADATTSDVTAQVIIGGTASKPTLKLTSTPELPQEEVLSRVLFGTSVGQISPAQGLQLAAAAQSLASGGPGLLDRLRDFTGLDRLGINSGTTSSATGSTASSSSASSSKGALGGATVSGGKYVANGVFVGVDQGASTSSTKARVEVELGRGLSVESTVGARSSSSLGLNWKKDY
jgi:translocation and assembly module TamB